MKKLYIFNGFFLIGIGEAYQYYYDQFSLDIFKKIFSKYFDSSLFEGIIKNNKIISNDSKSNLTKDLKVIDGYFINNPKFMFENILPSSKNSKEETSIHELKLKDLLKKIQTNNLKFKDYLSQLEENLMKDEINLTKNLDVSIEKIKILENQVDLLSEEQLKKINIIQNRLDIIEAKKNFFYSSLKVKKIDLKDLLEQIRNSFNLENSSIDTFIFSKDEEIRSLVNKSYLSETLSEEDKKITSKRIIEKITEMNEFNIFTQNIDNNLLYKFSKMKAELNTTKLLYIKESDKIKELMKEKFDCLNILNTCNIIFDKSLKIYKENYEKLTKEDIEKFNYFNELNKQIKNQIEANISNIKELEINISNKNLNIEQNENFLTFIYKSHNRELMTQILKLYENSNTLDNKHQNHIFQDALKEKVNELKNLTCMFNDNFASEILSQVILNKSLVCTNEFIVNLWKNLHHKLITGIILDKYQDKNSFLAVPEVYFFKNVTSNHYLQLNPNINDVNLFDQQFVSSIKLISFIDYYVKKKNYQKVLESLSLLKIDELDDKKNNTNKNRVSLNEFKFIVSSIIERNQLINILDEHFKLKTNYSNLKVDKLI